MMDTVNSYRYKFMVVIKMMKKNFGKLLIPLTLILSGPALADMDKAYQAEKDGDFKTAYAEYLKEAEAGNTQAMVMIGLYYAQGQVVERDEKKSNEWMEKAAKLGDPGGELNMGIAYKIGIGGLKKDDKKAFEWFQSAAEKGLAQAEYETAVAYQYGVGVPRDFNKAREWYLKAAEQNHAAAQNNLAGIYGDGQGVPKNAETARSWLEKAAANENPDALYTLGVIYHQGVGVKQDFTEAANYFRRAFVAGKSEAAAYLAEYHYMGKGVGKSPVNAMMWLMLGTEISSTVPGGQMNQQTLQRLEQNKDFLASELSIADMARAKKQKDDFIKENLDTVPAPEANKEANKS
ncbi:MAG: tetratricopeptide repeat protein [Emcibacteraceae bacterium]